jgi:hypothetical protein
MKLLARLRRLSIRLDEWHRQWQSYKEPKHIHVGSEPLPGVDYEEPVKS